MPYATGVAERSAGGVRVAARAIPGGGGSRRKHGRASRGHSDRREALNRQRLGILLLHHVSSEQNRDQDEHPNNHQGVLPPGRGLFPIAVHFIPNLVGIVQSLADALIAGAAPARGGSGAAGAAVRVGRGRDWRNRIADHLVAGRDGRANHRRLRENNVEGGQGGNNRQHQDKIRDAVHVRFLPGNFPALAGCIRL